MAMSFTDAARVLTARIRELEAVSVDVDVIADPDPMLATARLRVNGLGIAAWTGRCANDSTPEAYALEVARCLKKALKMHASAHVKRAWDRSSRASCATCEGSQRVCEDPLHHRYSTLLGLAVCLKNCADSRECPDCETKGK
jgi:hypothetical protein